MKRLKCIGVKFPFARALSSTRSWVNWPCDSSSSMMLFLGAFNSDSLNLSIVCFLESGCMNMILPGLVHDLFYFLRGLGQWNLLHSALAYLPGARRMSDSALVAFSCTIEVFWNYWWPVFLHLFATDSWRWLLAVPFENGVSFATFGQLHDVNPNLIHSNTSQIG